MLTQEKGDSLCVEIISIFEREGLTVSDGFAVLASIMVHIIGSYPVSDKDVELLLTELKDRIIEANASKSLLTGDILNLLNSVVEGNK